jgi:hypothetical protein
MAPTADKRFAVYAPVVAGGAVALCVSLLWPPAFWLCGIGAVVLAVAASIASIGRRKVVWIFWVPKATPPLASWEVALSLTAVMLLVVPLIVIVFRDIASR